MSDRRNADEDNLLDRAVASMRDDPMPELPEQLIARTQSAVRDELGVSRRTPAFSLLRHPLLRVAAAFALIVTALAAFVVLRHRWNTQVAMTEPKQHPVPVPPQVASSKETSTVPVSVPPPTDPDVIGVVHFSGVAPKPQVISMAANAACAAHHRGPVVDESVLVNKDGTLRNVVVWISHGLEGRKFAPPKQPAVLDQLGCVYTPHVVTVMTGQQLLVKNSDPFLHNVHAAESESNPLFNFGQPTKNLGGIPLRFLSPDRMFVKCDVHPWMNAYILVLDNPFFAVTGEHGTFKLPELPAGTYTVSAWHEVYGEQDQRVTVEPGRPVSVDFTFRPTEHASAAGASSTHLPCCEKQQQMTSLAAVR